MLGVPAGVVGASGVVFAGALDARTSAWTSPDMFPLPVALYARTVMFAQLPAPTFSFNDDVVLLRHTPFRLTL